MILITGAGGKTGRAIVERLAELGCESRGLVKDPEAGRRLVTLGATEFVVADMVVEAAVAEAMTGIRAVYHICPNMHPDELEIGAVAIRAASEAGVEHFVYHSVLHPQIQEMSHHWCKMQVEEKLFASKLVYTILQPAPYMQNLHTSIREILKAGSFEVPFRETTSTNLLDLRDLAEVAAEVLLNSKFFYGTYEICGPDNLTQSQVAKVLGICFGRRVNIKCLSRDKWARRAHANGLGEYSIGTLIKMFEYYEKHDFFGNARELESILGRPSTNLERFVRRDYLGSRSANA